MKQLRFTGEFKDLLAKRFIKEDRGFFGIGCYQKPIEHGIVCLVYPDKRVAVECNGLYLPGIRYAKPFLEKLGLPFEEFGEDDYKDEE